MANSDYGLFWDTTGHVVGEVKELPYSFILDRHIGYEIAFMVKLDPQLHLNANLLTFFAREHCIRR